MAALKINADRLRREMAARGWNGVDLAHHAGVSPATLSHALNGHPVTTATLNRLARALSKAPLVEGVEELLA